jgi:chromosome segregation ATPase
MCKKLLIAAVAIVVGLTVVRHTSFGSWLQVWWHDARQSMERQIPPEAQVKRLANEIDKIDRDIKKNLSNLAGQKVDCQLLEERITSLRASQNQLKDDIAAMTRLLDSRTEKVSFKDVTYRATDLARKLDLATTLYTTRRGELKNKEELLAQKKQALEAAEQRITAMRDQKEQLRVSCEKLKTRIELLRLRQMEARVDLDDSQVGRCNELLGQLDTTLRKLDMEAKLQTDFGYRTTTPALDREPRSTEEILRAARRALQEEGDSVAAGQK